MRGLSTIEVRGVAEELVIIDAIIAASKYLKGNYMNKLRIAVRNTSAALAEVTHWTGFENRISALEERLSKDCEGANKGGKPGYEGGSGVPAVFASPGAPVPPERIGFHPASSNVDSAADGEARREYGCYR